MEQSAAEIKAAPAPYPGSDATALEVLALAEEYHRAAILLLSLGRRHCEVSRLPFRLAAIQATELYLNALLMERGHTPANVRGLQHDLAARMLLAQQAGLGLRARTASHLASLSANREYMTARYEPNPRNQSALNRLCATLDEVAAKVGCRLRSQSKVVSSKIIIGIPPSSPAAGHPISTA